MDLTQNYHHLPILLPRFLLTTLILCSFPDQNIITFASPTNLHLVAPTSDTKIFGSHQTDPQDMTPKELSTFVNSRQHSDYEVSKVFYSVDSGKDENFREVWQHFQPDHHVRDNAPFSAAVMHFFTGYFGFELSHWLNYLSFMDERITQYMGLGLRDSQISSGNINYDLKYLLENILSLAGNSDAFSKRKSICQRVLLMSRGDLSPSIGNYPSLIACATARELSDFFKSTESNTRFEKIKDKVADFSVFQKDALVRELNKLRNFHVVWRTEELHLAQFDFMERELVHRELSRSKWKLTSLISQLPIMSRWHKTEPDASWTLEFLNTFEEAKMIEFLTDYDTKYLRTGHRWSAVKDIMRQMNSELCDQFTIHQRHLVSNALNKTIKKSSFLDMTGWSNLEKEEFSCFLEIRIPELPNSSPPEKIVSRDNLKKWGEVGSLDEIFEELFYNGSKVSTREEAIAIVRAIRSVYRQTHDTNFEKLSQLAKHEFNVLPGFILREFWTSEFDFQITSGGFGMCRESFIKVGSIDNSDLSPEKRQKLVEAFMNQCQGVFEDNLRVLNSLVCDWNFKMQILSSEEIREAWVSRARDCTIANNNIATSVWEELSKLNLSLNELLFSLGPSNLCQVVPLDFWNSSSTQMTYLDHDRFVWTLMEIDRAQNEMRDDRKCLQAAVRRLSHELEDVDKFPTYNKYSCPRIAIPKTLNKYLEDDWLIQGKAENRECVNLIGSNPTWFTQEQLSRYVETLEKTLSEQILHGEKVHWKLNHLVPFLNTTSFDTIMGQLSTNIETSKRDLQFIAQLNWPLDERFKANSLKVAESYGALIPTTNALVESHLGNILCSFPFYSRYIRTTGERTRIQTNFYCNDQGHLIPAPIPFSAGLIQNSLLMDPRNVAFEMYQWNSVNDLKLVPLEVIKHHVNNVIDQKLVVFCSIDQKRYLLEKHFEKLEAGLRELLRIEVDSGESIEIRKEEPKETANESEDQELEENQDMHIEQEYEYASSIIYITLSSEHLKQSVAISLALVVTNLALH